MQNAPPFMRHDAYMVRRFVNPTFVRYSQKQPGKIFSGDLLALRPERDDTTRRLQTSSIHRHTRKLTKLRQWVG